MCGAATNAAAATRDNNCLTFEEIRPEDGLIRHRVLSELIVLLQSTNIVRYIMILCDLFRKGALVHIISDRRRSDHVAINAPP
jgi:hypothetical protein